MPNWCSNNLTIRHNDALQIERAVSAFKEQRLLNEFVPCPEELRAENTGFANAEVKAERMTKYGYESWYDWSIEHWGTKWDVGGDAEDCAEIDEHTLIMNFDSAWSPPLQALKVMEAQGFEIAIMWDEPGLAFCGWYVTDGSQEIFHYQDWTAADAKQKIPEKIDDTFGIVDRIESYEQEMNNDTI